MDKQVVKVAQEVARNLGQIATELTRLRRLKVQELRQQNPNLKMDRDLEGEEMQYPTLSPGPLVEDVLVNELNEGDEILWKELGAEETWKTVTAVFGRNAGARMPLTVRFGGEVYEEHHVGRHMMVTRKVRQ